VWHLHTVNSNISPPEEGFSSHDTCDQAMQMACDKLKEPHMQVLYIQGPSEQISLEEIQGFCQGQSQTP
jgi:hypothetical protein